MEKIFLSDETTAPEVQDLVLLLKKSQGDDDSVRVSSRLVAEKFGKLHKNVLQAIENLVSELGEGFFSELNFQRVTYVDEQGKSRPEYLLTKDGFCLIAMGFTGKEALQWKVLFIQAFNKLLENVADLKEENRKLSATSPPNGAGVGAAPAVTAAGIPIATVILSDYMKLTDIVKKSDYGIALIVKATFNAINAFTWIVPMAYSGPPPVAKPIPLALL